MRKYINRIRHIKALIEINEELERAAKVVADYGPSQRNLFPQKFNDDLDVLMQVVRRQRELGENFDNQWLRKVKDK